MFIPVCPKWERMSGTERNLSSKLKTRSLASCLLAVGVFEADLELPILLPLPGSAGVHRVSLTWLLSLY